jgi:putative transposase
MRRPPRVDAPGEIHLVTTNAWNRRPILTTPSIASLILETLLDQSDRDRFELHAWVLMPDHIHIVIQPGQRPLVEVVRRFKSLSWKRCHQQAGFEKRLWQDGFHDRGVRSERAFRAQIDYVHLNPVRANLVAHAEDWPWSSFSEHFDLVVGRGQAPPNCS